MMRRIQAGLFMSLDGVVESPDRFVFPYFSEEVGRAVEAGVQAADAMLLGRRTYEEWAAYWPGVTPEQDEFSSFINPVQKYVVSDTLEELAWGPSTLISGDVAQRVAALKDGPGKAIGMSGSITLIGSLLRMGLLDELGLLVFPVVVGSGKRLFESDAQIPLRLTGSKTFDNGVLSLTYGRAE